jgi:hypothetical protein
LSSRFRNARSAPIGSDRLATLRHPALSGRTVLVGLSSSGRDPILRWLEPFALDLRRHELDAWLPEHEAVVAQRQFFCGGLYQVLVLTIEPGGKPRRYDRIR